MTDEHETPNEIVTLYYCHGCEMVNVAGNAERGGHVSDGTGDQLECGRCSTRLNADSFYDYVDMRVVDY